MVTDVAGLEPVWVPAVRAIFCVGSLLGVTISGRLADAHSGVLLAVGGLRAGRGLGRPRTDRGRSGGVAGADARAGTLPFGTGSTVIARVLYAATGAFSAVSLNVGAAAGPWLGGLAIAAALGYRSPLWISAALAATALALLVAGRRLVATNRPRRAV